MNRLTEVGTYERTLGASLDRLIENALDWEHLPHLHGSSFASIAVTEHGAEGWRAEARLADDTPVELDLRLSGHEWTTSTRAAGELRSRIVSRAEARGPDACHVSVTFFAADVPAEKCAAVGAYYRRLYDRLYDEDERMMIARTEAIRRGPAALRERRNVRLHDGSMAEAPLYCPHQGLPLEGEPDAEGIIRCPWHGYLVDVRTGRCSPPHALR